MNSKTCLPALALLLAGLASACSTDPASATASSPVSASAPSTPAKTKPQRDRQKTVRPQLKLPDGDYAMAVEMRLATTEGIQFPHDPIPPANYEPAQPGEVLHIRFSGNGSQVGLPQKQITGTLERTGPQKHVYRLSEGLFAGGGLIVEETSKGLVSTYTVFGSGEPVLSSRKGPLVQVKSK